MDETTCARSLSFPGVRLNLTHANCLLSTTCPIRRGGMIAGSLRCKPDKLTKRTRYCGMFAKFSTWKGTVVVFRMNKKKPNAQDATRRNTQAANKKLSVHNTRLKELERRVKRLEKAVNEHWMLDLR